MAKRRKTKEEKIIAKLRKELKEVKRELRQLKKEKEPKKKQLISSFKPQPSSIYLKKDLTKALILSILAIGIELVIYLVYHK